MQPEVQSITYNDVTFRYTPEKEPVIDGFNLSIEKGETVAFVGESGSGKTSIVNLLPRLYDLSSGELLINDIPIEQYTLTSLRDSIAYVSQEVNLFNDSVANNISYGSLRDSSREDIIDAAQRAHADEFISAMPQGYDTEVGEDGVLLSGGQRQRIAIARAFLKNAPILILDEATSALDSASERAIQQGLENLRRGRTTLIVAHRLSTIESADRIIVLGKGKIIEHGNHASLIEGKGLYAELHRMQAQGTDSS